MVCVRVIRPLTNDVIGFEISPGARQSISRLPVPPVMSISGLGVVSPQVAIAAREQVASTVVTPDSTPRPAKLLLS
jgi:hypothetical protein